MEKVVDSIAADSLTTETVGSVRIVGEKRNKHFLGLLIALLVPMLFGCKDMDRIAYSHYESIGGGSWDPSYVIGFSPTPLDTTLSPNQEYDLVLNIRYKGSCPASELPLLISEETAEGEMDSRVIKVRIRDKNGSPLGKKGLVLYELSDTIRTHFKVPEGYWVEIMSMCPEEYSEGITEVGLSLVK